MIPGSIRTTQKTNDWIPTKGYDQHHGHGSDRKPVTVVINVNGDANLIIQNLQKCLEDMGKLECSVHSIFPILRLHEVPI